jgi:glycosyltransferase involved in cell wall biosynthesis
MLAKLIPAAFLANFRWDAYKKADAFIVLTDWEAEVTRILFNTDESKLHVVPNGVEDDFFRNPELPRQPGDELVCTATITERKRVLELAEAAVEAKVPIRILGKPYGEDDPYYRRFLALASESPEFVRYGGGVSNRRALADIYQQARGFVLLSTMESLSLSALEAAASGCPLLLSDLPWSRCTFGNSATYCPVFHIQSTAAILRTFYDQAPTLPKPPPPCRWSDVATQLLQIYKSV